MRRTIQYLFYLTLLLPLLLISNLSLSQAATAANEFLDMDIAALMQAQITSVSRQTQSMADAATEIFVITQKDLHDTGSELQPCIRLRWQPYEHHTLWATVSRAVRTPSRDKDSAVVTLKVIPLPPPFPGLPFNATGNNPLQAEELIAYEAGYRYYSSSNFSADLGIVNK